MSSSSVDSFDLASAKQKIVTVIAYESLPRSLKDPSWPVIQAEAKLTLGEFCALKNACCTSESNSVLPAPTDYATLYKEAFAQAKEELKEEMQRCFAGMVDSRLKYFNPELSAASKYEDDSPELATNLNEKSAVKSFARCMACDRTSEACKLMRLDLTCAHILSSKASASELSNEFGIGNNYVDDVDLNSRRNYLLLCGNLGLGTKGSCYDAYKCREISMFYSPEDNSFKWYRMDNLEDCFNADGFDGNPSDISRSAPGLKTISVTPEISKYRRLLAWRTINALIKAGNKDILKDRSGFIDYLKRSEEEECDE